MAGAVVDVLVSDGIIRRHDRGIEAPGGCAVVDAQSGILLPAFVDGHIHLDKTYWGLPWRPHQAGPTVLDRIENERRLRRELDLEIDVRGLARELVI